ncbi:PRC-barrel domain-containing protein [Streptomyces sp. NPDC059371]|uniref:PRC-barrel domain-containing protein n=1 Tax=Streptomyces sp. NPDC059371 TaxID=3346812 RepID=UPI0036A68233
MSDNIWGYQPATDHTAGTDLIGYKVEATDGSIGKVDKHSDDVNSAYLVVDTGVWILGKHVLLPAGTVQSVDQAERKIYVALTKDQIKDSPEFDKDKQVGSYYQTQRGI